MASMSINDSRLIKPVMHICFCSATFLLKGVLDKWFRRRFCLKIFLIWSSNGPFCSAQQNRLYNFGRGYYELKFREIILNLDQWSRRCLLKIFLNWSSGSPFVQRS